MGALLSAVVPVAFIVLVGFFAGRVLPFDLESLSQLTLYVLVPALIFDGLYNAGISLGNALDILAGFVLTHLLLYLAVLGVGWTMKLYQATRKSLLATTLFSNSGNLSLPLVLFVLGQEGLERAVIYFVASSLLMFGLGPCRRKPDGDAANSGIVSCVFRLSHTGYQPCPTLYCADYSAMDPCSYSSA